MTDVIKYLEKIKEHQMNNVQFAKSTEVYKLADKALKAINYTDCSEQFFCCKQAIDQRCSEQCLGCYTYNRD